jgi:plastocyanin
MSDETTDTLIEEPPAQEPVGDVVAAESAAIEPASAPVSFWNRPNVERYLVPIVIPIVVIIGLVMYVLNLSRVFLAAHGHIPVVVGSVILVGILVGATIFTNSKHLRSSSIALMTTLFALVIFTSGWLVLGHSQEKGLASTPLSANGPVSGKIDATALASLKFTPVAFTVKTGIYMVTLTDGAAGPHTMDFDSPETLFKGLAVNAQGEKDSSRIFFGTPGSYTFFCAIPGHRAAGMQGTVTVTGSPMTLSQAEAAAK